MAPVSVPAPASRPNALGGPAGRAAVRPGRLAAAVPAGAGLVASLGASTWLVAAAAERPSVLSPPTLRAHAPWLRGPLSGLLPGLSTDPARLRHDLTVILVILFAAWLVAWIAAPALPVRVVAALVAAAQVVWVLGPPQPLTDTFNYLVYGRMAARGLNPYTHVPLQARHDTAYALSNWHHLPSPYGPVFTLLSEPLGLLATPAAFWVWKLVVLACALGVLALVWWLALELGRSPQRALAFAGLCPVTLAIGLGGFHNDAPAVLCVVGAAACLVRGRRPAPGGAAGGPWWAWSHADAAAGALAILAAGIKPSMAVAVPIVVLAAHRRLAAATGAAWAAAAVVAVVVLAFGGALPALGLQDGLVTPLSAPNLLGLAAGHGGADAGVRALGRDSLVAVTLVATGLVAWRRRLALPVLGLLLLAVAVSLSWVLPWYLAWSLPFAALATPRALVPLAVVGCVWMGLAGVPQLPALLHDVGYHPTSTATGLANHDYEVQLVR